MPNSTEQGLIDIAINKLWSSNDGERTAGIKELERVGEEAIEPLVLLLTDLVRRQEPRFPPEKQEEGDIALQEYVTALVKLSEDAGNRYDEIKKAGDRLSTLAINSRLMTDVVDLLGRLEAEQAVPILIEIVNGRGLSGLAGAGLGERESHALCRIGGAAVPRLIEALDERNIRAFGRRRVVYGYWVRVEAAGNSESGENAQSDQAGEDDESVLPESDEREINLIRERVVWVLGEIADPRSLPSLHELLRTTGDATLKFRLREAIARIERTGLDSTHFPLLLQLRRRDHR